MQINYQKIIFIHFVYSNTMTCETVIEIMETIIIAMNSPNFWISEYKIILLRRIKFCQNCHGI